MGLTSMILGGILGGKTPSGGFNWGKAIESAVKQSGPGKKYYEPVADLKKEDKPTGEMNIFERMLRLFDSMNK